MFIKNEGWVFYVVCKWMELVIRIRDKDEYKTLKFCMFLNYIRSSICIIKQKNLIILIFIGYSCNIIKNIQIIYNFIYIILGGKGGII